MGEPVAARVPRLLTIKETAVCLHRHPQTVRQMIRDGDLDYVQVGRSKMVRDDQLADYIERQSVSHDDDDDDGPPTQSHPSAARLSHRPAPPTGNKLDLRRKRRGAS